MTTRGDPFAHSALNGGRGWSLMIFCARATRGLRRPSLDARNRRSISPHPFEEKMNELEKDHFEIWHRPMRAVKDSPATPCPNRGLSLNTRYSSSDKATVLEMGVGKRGGDQLALEHMSREDVLKAEGAADLCHCGQADGTISFHLSSILSGVVYKSTTTCKLDRSRSRNRFRKIASSAIPFCAPTAPFPPHFAEGTEPRKAALLAAVLFCRRMPHQPPSPKKQSPE